MKTYFKNLFTKLKAEIVQSVDECICGEILPYKFFQEGGRCKKCGFYMYETKPKIK